MSELKTIEVKDLGQKANKDIYNIETYPEAGQLYVLSDGIATWLGWRGDDGCIQAIVLPQDVAITYAVEHRSSVGGLLREIAGGVSHLSRDIEALKQHADTLYANLKEDKGSGVSEDVLLKLAAIAQNPELIKDL